MTDNDKDNSPAEAEHIAQQPTVGTLLKTAREAAGLTIADIAGHLKLSLPQLQALESDDFERLPGPVFVRGFARSYARYLHMDEAPLLAALERQLPRPAPVEHVAETEMPFADERKPLPWRLIGGGVAVLIVIVIAGWWLWGGSRQQTVEEGQDPNTLVPMMTGQSASDSGATSMPVVPDASASAAGAPTGQSALLIKTNAPVWVSVRDADGNKLMNATLAANASQTVNGKPPLKVRVSNITRLTLSYNNQPVDLNTYKHGRRLGARFELK